MNVVVTSLLTKEPDPMRGRKWDADPSILETWAASIKGATPVVIADELTTTPQGVQLVNSSDLASPNVPSGGPYFNRWVYFLQWLYLNEHSLDKVWLTDGSDVTMLREPWDQMEEGVLYVGSEEQHLVGCDWMRNINHHPSPIEQLFIDSERDLLLLNAGLVGGHVKTVQAFLAALLVQWAGAGWPTKSDMAIFNLTAYCNAPARVVTGELVHTTFWANADNGTAWWQHK